VDKFLEWMITGGVLGLVIFVLANHRETDGKIKRVYNRLDEVKDAIGTRHVSKEVCAILHKQLGDDVKEIKMDVKKLLSKG